MKFKRIMIFKRFYCILRKIKEISRILLKFLKIFENFEENSRNFDRKTVKCQYLLMNRHFYLYYLCSNYLTTATKHRPYWGEGGAQHLYWGAIPSLPPPAGYGPAWSHARLFNFKIFLLLLLIFKLTKVIDKHSL